MSPRRTPLFETDPAHLECAGVLFAPTMKTYTTNDSLWTDLKALPRSYWVLFSGTLINRFGHFVMPFLALYLQREGFPVWVTALALGAYKTGGPAIGLNLISTSMAILIIMMVAFTVGEMISLPIANSYIAGLAPEDMRGRFMGVLGVA